MKTNHVPENGIPVSVSLNDTLQAEQIFPGNTQNKNRIIYIAMLAVGIAAITSCIAKILVALINLVTNIAFHGIFSAGAASPMGNTLGLWVIAIPVIGGIIVGLMALYGSKAIRGHGIPEAMEQILTNQSKIKPAITYLKPLSSAIAIGTGGPFGAEGPIIATGGALGSTIGQLLKITHNERKILLTSGASAGMAAIFGSPIAAIFLAIELLLFEFSARSIIPVALACITGAAGHYFMFERGLVFALPITINTAGFMALAGYSITGILIGLIAVGITKSIYFIEDLFEKLPVHWMWWPAMGGIAVGVIGYFYPATLGVGYQNITSLLTGNLPVQFVLGLCILKFASWAISLSSGTSGGTLAPLLTIGAALGMLMGSVILYFFPSSGVTLPLAALVGMSALFAGASRALLTSIIFALETTGQVNALLPLLAACTASYFVSFLLMKNTIMTEKIDRRGVKTPDLYEPDLLENKKIKDIMDAGATLFREHNTIEEIINWLQGGDANGSNYFVIVNNQNRLSGILRLADLLSNKNNPATTIQTLIKKKDVSVYFKNSLKYAVEKMAIENVEILAVVDEEKNVIGVLTYKDIIATYKLEKDIHNIKKPHISLKKQGLKILVHGHRLIKMVKKENN